MLKKLERIQALSNVYDRLLKDVETSSVDLASGNCEREKAQADVAIGLLQEYGELYRHYDTQRAAYVSALTAIAVTATAAEFYAKLPERMVFGSFLELYPLATILFALGAVGFIATRKSRLRMKLFYERFSNLRKILAGKFPDLQIEESVKSSRSKIESSGPLSWLYSKPTRGFAWDAIPIFLVVIGGLLMIAHGVVLFPVAAYLIIAVTIVSDVAGAALQAGSGSAKRNRKAPRKLMAQF